MTTRFAGRFWAKVDIRGRDECWPWLRCKQRLGYGRVGVGYEVMLAHRVAYALRRGPVPPSLHVCHACDNPVCVNPGHLFLGTQSENITDCWQKGRRHMVPIDNHGQRHGMAKLTNEQVIAIRSAAGSQRAIAKNFGVSQGAVQLIRAGKRWGHI